MINKNSYFKVYVDKNGLVVDVEWAEGCKEVVSGELKTNPIKGITINNIQSIELITGTDNKGNISRVCHIPPCKYFSCLIGKPELSKK